MSPWCDLFGSSNKSVYICRVLNQIAANAMNKLKENKRSVICLCGNSGSGKSYLADYLCNHMSELLGESMRVISRPIAKGVKDALKCLYPSLTDEGEDVLNSVHKDEYYINMLDGQLIKDLKDVSGTYLLCDAKSYDPCITNNTIHATKPIMSLRELMVYFGTYMGLDRLSKYIWVSQLPIDPERENSLWDDHDMVIIPDVRFDHEWTYISLVCAKNDIQCCLVRVESDVDNGLDNRAEHALNISQDYVFKNTKGDDELFKSSCVKLLHNICHGKDN